MSAASSGSSSSGPSVTGLPSPGAAAGVRSSEGLEGLRTVPSASPGGFAGISSVERRMAYRTGADRKRRLTTSAGEDARLQRTRLGGADGSAQDGDGSARAALPHRSVSMVVPSSRTGGSVSAAPGSSYATAIDLSSPSPRPPARGEHGMRRSLTQGRSPWPGEPSGALTPPGDEDGEYTEMTLPRWQPDSEVTSCPICETVFSFWYRKHHCRKCGRVVCAACSPHRITIPRQYIVRPPESANSLPHSSPIPPSRTPHVVDLTGDGPGLLTSTLNPALGGGEEVRLCNPCVPDPNPNPLGYGTVRAHGHRPTRSLSSAIDSRHFAMPRDDSDGRQGRRTSGGDGRLPFLREFGQQVRQSIHDTIPNLMYDEFDRHRAHRVAARLGASPPSGVSSGQQTPSSREGSAGVSPVTSSPRLRRRSIVSERDLCPVCGRRFPPLTDDQPLEAREAHVRHCIENYAVAPAQRGSPSVPQSPPPPPPPVAHLLDFTATEKDCIGDDGGVAECTICMEDYEVGQALARLECFCKFHRACIVGWFERKRECPVHKLS